MSSINVQHAQVTDLAADLDKIAAEAPRGMISTVREGIKVGNVVARDYARKSAGRHGKHYPKAFSSEMHGLTMGIGSHAATYSGEYGPNSAMPQGGMSFEYGSRNQKPHLDLARSADLMGPAFQGEVRRLPDKWFW